MDIKHKKLTLKQLNTALGAFKPLETQTIPQKGWVRAIRDALGMSARQLAKRMGVKQQRIVRIEQDEKQGRVTVNTLRNAAEAMECEFGYGFVPKQSLEQTIRDQARRVAVNRMERSNQMMRLEAQELSEAEKQEMINDMVTELMYVWPRNLWDE